MFLKSHKNINLSEDINVICVYCYKNIKKMNYEKR